MIKRHEPEDVYTEYFDAASEHLKKSKSRDFSYFEKNVPPPLFPEEQLDELRSIVKGNYESWLNEHKYNNATYNAPQRDESPDDWI